MRRILISAPTWLALGLAALAVHGSAWGQTRELATRGELLDRVVAIVNDGVVLNSDLDAQIDAITERMRQQRLELPPQNVLRQQVLERLVVQEIELQHAGRAGVKVTDEMLNSALTDVAKRNNITLTQLPDTLKQQGIDYPSYREEVRKEITLTVLRQRDVLQHISITPREIDQFLDKQARTPSEHSEFNVSHILISVGQEASPEQIDAAAKRAQEVYERAKGGEDFAKLAVAYSNSQTALEGGALGWRKGSELPTFLSDTVAKLKPGEVGEPLRTPTGFHIVKLNEVRGGSSENSVEDQIHVRHILMKTNELADDATVRTKLLALRERILKGEDFAGIAQVSSEDPGSAAEGGDLGWSGPGTFAPEFETVINGLKDNEISEPFHTQFGWHLAQVLGRRRYDNTNEIKRRQAMEAIRASKADEETELWLRRMRDEAYVDFKS
jgi:peptidyl-prolyl cis-trans isomerase SurA